MLRRYVQRFLFVNPLHDILLTCGNFDSVIYGRALTAYSTETVDIEVLQGNHEWREVASTSRRTDFPVVPGFKPCNVFEVAFGMDRMVALSQDGL